MPVRSLTAGCNNAFKNLSKYKESIYAPLTSNLPNIMNDTSHLLDLIDDINKSSLPDKLILVPFDMINMFPNIDNERGMGAVSLLLEFRSSKNPSRECVMEGLKICLLKNNSRSANIQLQQINNTAIVELNSGSYSDIAINQVDKIINEKTATQFQECF